MAFFRYQFTDAKGNVLEGTLQATTEAEAEALIRLRGYPNASLINPNAIPVQAVAPALPPRIDTSPKIKRTRKGSDKDRFFLFSQFAKLLNAGINPAKAFEEVARVTRIEHFKGSFHELAADVTNGKPISETMARYPDLYPDHIVGMLKAAEAGGFLPEAFAVISGQAEDAYKFKRFHWFIWYLIPRAIASIPLVFAFRVALLEMARAGTGDLVPRLFQQIIWPYGPITLAIIGIMLLLRWWLGTYPMRHFRHRMGLKAPIYGPRARNESIAVFTWTLSKLSKAGISPNSSWKLATETVPNLEMQARLTDAASRMHTGSRLSDVVFGSRIFPDEYAPIISTGELVGDVPGALEQLERVSRNEFEETSKKAKWGSMRIAGVFAILTSGLILIVVVKTWYSDAIEIFAPGVLSGEEQ